MATAQRGSVLTAKIRRDLLQRRVRTVLTLVGIAVGVAGLVAVSVTARQLGVAQERLTTGPTFPDLSVRTEVISPRVAALAERQLAGTIVEGRLRVDTRFSAGGPWRDASLIAFVGDIAPRLSPPVLVEGQLPGPGEVVFDASVTALAPLDLGDIVTVRQDAGAPTRDLTVVGLTRTPAALDAGILNRAVGYVAESEATALLSASGINQLLVRLPPDTDPSPASTALGRLLDRRGIARGPVVAQEGELLGARELQTLVWLLLAFSVIGLGLSGVLVGNTVAATVQDEARQIGALKALGATRRRVAVTYLLPALVLGAAGTVLGYAAGLIGGQGIVAYLTRLLGYPRPPVAVTPREVGLAVLVGLGIPILAAVGPALLAARRPTASLLRSHGLAERTGARIGPFGRLLGRRPIAALAVRNAVRRRLRAAMTVALIAVAVAAAAAAQGLSSSLDTTVAGLYADYGSDAWVTFDRPVTPELVQTVARAPGVVAAEPWSRDTGYIADASIDLWAVPASTTLYTARLVDGRWYAEGEPRAAVASSSLARRLAFEVGDSLALDLGDETRGLTLVGIVDDESTHLGSTAAGKLFLAPETLGGFGGATGFTVLAVAFDRHDPAAVEARLTALEDRFAELGPRPYAAYADQAATARTVQVLVVLLRAMVALVALTGLVGIVNTLAMTVAERRREIGVVRSLGAGRRHLATLVVGEALTLGTAGLLLGVAVGVPLAALLVRLTGDVLFRLAFRLPPVFFATALIATLAACALAALGPALVAARIRPAAVLRYE